jgi:hypothetical protein
METIEINNLLWDTENLEVNDKSYFTHDEALAAAKEIGKRLPTKDELKALSTLGSTWDDERIGRWFGEDSELKQESEKSIFFPASGYRNLDGALNGVGYGGFYWSSSVSGKSDAYSLYFGSSFVYPADDDYRDYGQSVLCVSDILK